MSERDILIRVTLVTLVAVGALWFGLISPKRGEASKQITRVTTAQTRVGAAQQKVTAGLAAAQQAPANRRVLAQLGTALPDSAGAAALLRELNGTSNHDNVAFRTASIASAGGGSAASTGTAQLPPGASLGPGGLPTLPLTLTFDGRYLSLTTLLDRLRKFVGLAGQRVVVHGRLLSVEGFQLSRDATSPTVSASLAATAYLAPVPVAASPAAPGTPATPGGSATSSAGTTTTASAGATP